MIKKPRPLLSEGFTIVELMVATLVFSVVLLLVTFGVLQVTRTYYKGLTEIDNQTTARNIVDSISRAIQFGGNVQQVVATNPGDIGVICVGNQQFSYRLGWEVTDSTPVTTNHETPHALYVTDSVANCTGNIPNLAITTLSGGKELVGSRMRLAKLSVMPVAGNTSLYKVTVKVVYGDDDLLLSPTDNTTAGPTMPDIKCQNFQAGTQFCAVSELTAVVEKRVK